MRLSERFDPDTDKDNLRGVSSVRTVETLRVCYARNYHVSVRDLSTA